MITKRILTIIMVAGVLLSFMSETRSVSALTPLREAPSGAKETLAVLENTNVIFIPPSAFNPSVDGYDYENYTALTHFHSPG